MRRHKMARELNATNVLVISGGLHDATYRDFPQLLQGGPTSHQAP